MAKRKSINSKQQYQLGFDLERSGDISGALKCYKKAVSIDPLNSLSWDRQMILYRKTKSRSDEIKLINTAISKYQKEQKDQQQHWLNTNQTKAKDTHELASILGLIESSGLPRSEFAVIKKWQTRLHLLTHRFKNERKKSSAG
jgi:tetratricopeptide (TPR) repeat protein